LLDLRHGFPPGQAFGSAPIVSSTSFLCASGVRGDFAILPSGQPRALAPRPPADRLVPELPLCLRREGGLDDLACGLDRDVRDLTPQLEHGLVLLALDLLRRPLQYPLRVGLGL